MIKRILYIFIILTFILISGCSDKDDESFVLNVSRTKMIFNAEDEKLSFEIKSNTDWEIVTNNESWLKVSPMSGSGDTKVFVEVSENMKETVQSAQLTVQSSFSSTVKTVSIKQNAAMPEPIDPESLSYPLLTIQTEYGRAINSKDHYIDATITIELKDKDDNLLEKILEVETDIKGRGNSTWKLDKKPYRLKLEKSTEMLGMPKNKHWVLLANHLDKTLMRNELAFEISRRMGFDYTPRMQYVDVMLNDDYVGNYMLVEHVRIDKNRVDIHELKHGSTNITGGYLLEIDERKSEPEWFETQKAKMIFCVRRPEDIHDNQKKYIANHIQKLENVIYGLDGANPVTDLPRYLDLKSFIDYYLLNELSKNVDGNLRLSTFVYKKHDDDKIYFGPVWDYDIAFGNVDYFDCDKYTGWYVRTAEWYKRILAYPEFYKMIKDRWKELRAGELADLNPFIDFLAGQLDLSQKKNFERWPIISNSYEVEVQYLKSWLTSRVNWMDQQLK